MEKLNNDLQLGIEDLEELDAPDRRDFWVGVGIGLTIGVAVGIT